MNGPILRGGGLPLADDDAGALDFLHEGVPVGELLRREGVRLDVDVLDDGADKRLTVDEGSSGEGISHEGKVNIRIVVLFIAGK